MKCSHSQVNSWPSGLGRVEFKLVPSNSDPNRLQALGKGIDTQPGDDLVQWLHVDVKLVGESIDSCGTLLTSGFGLDFSHPLNTDWIRLWRKEEDHFNTMPLTLSPCRWYRRTPFTMVLNGNHPILVFAKCNQCYSVLYLKQKTEWKRSR